MWIGTVTMAVGVMYAMVQTDLKRMLAFSTVSQIGYMMMGIGIGTPLAITAGLLHCLNHGFFKGGLFLTAGSVQHAAGTRDMNQLGGLAAKMPHTTLSWLIGVGSMMGIPLMSGFASKWMLYAAALQAGWAVPAMVAWAASLGTVFLGVKATSAVFLGPTDRDTKDAHEVSAHDDLGYGLFRRGQRGPGHRAAVGRQLLFQSDSLRAGHGRGRARHLARALRRCGQLLLDRRTGAGAGLACAWAARFTGRLRRAPLHRRRGDGWRGWRNLYRRRAASDQGRLTAGDFSDIFQEHWHSFFRWSNVDRVYLGVWHGLQALSRLLGGPSRGWSAAPRSGGRVCRGDLRAGCTGWRRESLQPRFRR